MRLAIVLALVASLAAQDKGDAKADPKRGQVVFQNNCDECHYSDSRETKTGPGLQGLKDGKLPDGRKATHDQILDIINTGPAEMPSFKDPGWRRRRREDLIAYLLTL